MLNAIKRKRCLYAPLLLLVLYVAVVYCAPYLEFEPKTLEPWPVIPFNFHEGPLKQSSASQFKVEHLFRDQISGAESISLDSQGNMYLAIEGGFILYAHLNKSAPLKKHYYESPAQQQLQQQQQQQSNPRLVRNNNDYTTSPVPTLIKIADLNWPKQQFGASKQSQRNQRQQQQQPQQEATSGQANNNLRRECQLDEQVYGPHLFAAHATADNNNNHHQQAPASGAEQVDNRSVMRNFSSRVVQSRCSKPLGTRLSPDEQYLYVIDTMSGLYRVNLKQAERPHSTQRQVIRLIDFRVNHYLPVVQLDSITSNDIDDTLAASGRSASNNNYHWQNVSLKAVDDLVIDHGAGSKSGDLIYLTVASLNWPAVAFLYQLLEGRPSGLVVCFDTGSNQLFALDPKRMAHVRTTNILTGDGYSVQLEANAKTQQQAPPPNSYGAPRLDENDIFDDRPLNFPNGLELTDDRQALLIADTANKRIIKHYIRGPRRGTSDLWAWTPHFPDNIRRGYDKQRETYWVIGCGRDESQPGLHIDLLVILRTWPRVRKFLVKNIYLLGSFMEWFGVKVFDSLSITDLGRSIRTGHIFCESVCPGMIVLQYNQHGELLRSIHSREFPNDLAYYSQVNELIDANEQEHSLYLSSPSYKYVTKLILPTESYTLPPEHLLANNGGFT